MCAWCIGQGLVASLRVDRIEVVIIIDSLLLMLAAAAVIALILVSNNHYDQFHHPICPDPGSYVRTMLLPSPFPVVLSMYFPACRTVLPPAHKPRVPASLNFACHLRGPPKNQR